jgi:hypothetical protein
VGVVDETIEYGVGQRRVGQELVPILDRKLRRHQRGAAVVSIFKDL